jgi:protein-S-isoprenylcysteine O-methyltransferase Ste14
MIAVLARWRVTLGFIAAAVALALARPTWRSLWIGLGIAVTGEFLRLWAAGHIEKGREITRSGPYRFVRHPLYLGSAMLGLGFAIAAASLPVVALTVTYLGMTLAAAVRTEEAVLDARFSGEYSRYRDGRAEPVARRFSWARALRNREYRAALGVAAVFAWLFFRLGS